ncbi:MAG: porin family protein [Chlorobiales bacterium]|nr:porin family protein [Chlorobiales bacterium]
MKKILVLLAALLCFTTVANAQTKPLSIEGGIGGGLSIGESDFSDFKGYNIGGKLKLDIPIFPFTVVGHVVYNALDYSNATVKIFSVGAGVEYPILLLPVLSPYISADAAMNFFSGDISKKITRTGAGIGVGAELAIPGLPVNFDVEAKYRFDNLFGKESNEGTTNHLQLWAQILFPLN